MAAGAALGNTAGLAVVAAVGAGEVPTESKLGSVAIVDAGTSVAVVAMGCMASPEDTVDGLKAQAPHPSTPRPNSATLAIRDL